MYKFKVIMNFIQKLAVKLRNNVNRHLKPYLKTTACGKPFSTWTLTDFNCEKGYKKSIDKGRFRELSEKIDKAKRDHPTIFIKNEEIFCAVYHDLRDSDNRQFSL